MPEVPGQPAPAQEQGAGGSIVDVLMGIDKQLAQVVQAVSKAQIPDQVKAAFSQAQEAFRAGLSGLNDAAGEGGGEAPPQAQPAGGVSTMEQGGNPNARPMSHAGG